MKQLTQFTLGLTLTFAIFASAHAQSWSADVMHSSVVFKIRHILTPFVGNFGTYSVDVVLNEDDLANASVNATIDPSSVDTRSEGRDKHLRSADFFDVEGQPGPWTFKSNSVEKTGDGEFLAMGTLTAKGKSVEVELPFKFLGSREMERGGRTMKKAGISAEFVLKRSDFGMGEESPMMGDEVTIMAFLEMNGK